MEQTLTELHELLLLDEPIVQLLLILVLGMLGHVCLRYFLRRLRNFAASSSQRWDNVAIDALEAPLRMMLWVIVFYLLLDVYPITGQVQAKLIPVFDTVLVLLVAWFLRRLIFGVERELLQEGRGITESVDKATVRATTKLLRVVLWIVASLMILQTLGVSISGLLAFGGIGGIAVGFAAKDLLANFFGGLSIYLDRPFTAGDWIRSPDKNIEGTVEEIGWRLTRIRTFDQRPLYVPNAIFSQISVENPSRMFNRRIYETIGLRYVDSAKLAPIVEQVHDMLREHAEIDLTRTLIVNFVSFGPSSLDFFVYTFTKTTNWVNYHRIKQDVLLKILDIVHSNGADIAFPTQTLHVEQVAAEPAQ